MNQHPIDDLFSRRLKEHSIQPGRASWEELQGRMNARRKKPFVWWYAAAAGVAVVGLAAWWVWSSYQNVGHLINGPQVARQGTMKPASATPSARLSIPEKQSEEAPVVAYRKPTVKASQPKVAAETKTVTAPVEQPAIESSREASAIVQPKLTETQLAVQEPKPIEPVTVSPRQSERTLVVQVAEPVLASAALPTQSVEESKIEPDEDEPRKKRFRVGRLLRQFNNLRTGEPVEWKDMGVQPGMLLARASEKVQEGKEKVANSYENLRYSTFKKQSDNR